MTCLKQCLKFGNSSPFPPLFFSLLLSHLHRKVQLALIREAEGKSNWARDQKHPYGDRLSPATLLTQRKATKTINEFLNEILYFCNGLCNVYECGWQGAGRMLSHTDLCVTRRRWGSISWATTPSTAFSCFSGVRTAVPPGPKSLSLPNLCLLFVPFDSFYPSLPSVFSFPPSLAFRDCLRKMTVPPQLAGLWLTETNK